MLTHQQSRVESIPVQSDSQRRGNDFVAYLQWPMRPCVHTSRVELSPTSLAESRLLMPACFIFVSQTPVNGRDGRNGCPVVGCHLSDSGQKCSAAFPLRIVEQLYHRDSVPGASLVRAGERFWVGERAVCTSLTLATHSFVWKRNFDIRKKG
jgi:hypothetical protein